LRIVIGARVLDREVVPQDDVSDAPLVPQDALRAFEVGGDLVHERFGLFGRDPDQRLGMAAAEEKQVLAGDRMLLQDRMFGQRGGAPNGSRGGARGARGMRGGATDGHSAYRKGACPRRSPAAATRSRAA